MTEKTDVVGAKFTTPGSYLSRVEELIPNAEDAKRFFAPDEPQLIASRSGRDPLTAVVNICHVKPSMMTEFKTSLDRLLTTTIDEPQEHEVCIIENVSPELIETLGQEFDIDPGFFAGYISNPAEEDLWKAHDPEEIKTTYSYQQLTGMFEYHTHSRLPADSVLHMQRCRRRVYGGYEWPALSPDLFLVDAPPPLPNFFSRESEVTLRFAYARNVGGFLIPRMHDLSPYRPGTVLDMLESCLRKRWEFSCLFLPHDSHKLTFPGVPFLYILCYCGWISRYEEVHRKIWEISFQKVKLAARLQDTVQLHELREELAITRDYISQTLTGVSSAARDYFADLGWHVYSHGVDDKTLFDGLKSIQTRADKSNQLLLETFQILMNTVAIQDAKSSLQMAESSLILARLAAVYLPLSLAAGVYGMNLAEMTGSGPPVWAFVLTAAVIALLTVCAFYRERIFWAFKYSYLAIYVVCSIAYEKISDVPWGKLLGQRQRRERTNSDTSSQP